LEARLISSGWQLVFATAHQRHLDRWMYEHDLIKNQCWNDQLNSSSSSTMKAQCSVNLSSVWENFTFSGDPYAIPLQGYCNAKQLTEQGEHHAALLGTIYRQHFTTMGLLSRSESKIRPSVSCQHGKVSPLEIDQPIVLETDNAQKNQKTTEMVYSGLCANESISLEQYPPSEVLDDGTVAQGRPFYINTAVCRNPVFSNLSAVAQQAMLASPFWTEVTSLASTLASGTDHPQPSSADAAAMLDNIEDCAVSHTCHGLADTPPFIYANHTFRSVDELETASRGWPFSYFAKSSDPTDLKVCSTRAVLA
jgi:hypothetical protein